MTTVSYHEHKGVSYKTLKNGLRFIGRILLSAIFLISGFNQAFDWSGVLAYVQTAASVPIPPFFLGLGILFQILGGLSILFGYKSRLGAILLIIFIIPTTLLFHHFWDLDNTSQMFQVHMFLKNVAIMGALFFIIANGPGAWSLDVRSFKSHRYSL